MKLIFPVISVFFLVVLALFLTKFVFDTKRDALVSPNKQFTEWEKEWEKQR